MAEKQPLLNSDHVYQGRRVTLRVDTIQLPSGRESQREIVEFGDCVAIVAVDSEGKALLVRQYRAAVGRMLLEIPAGMIDPGETPEQSAYRELREETGYSAKRMEPLGGLYASPGYSTEYLHFFLATELEESQDTPDEDEINKVVRVPLKDVPGLIDSGEISDGKSAAGLLRVILRMQS
ncbi:MAG: NUDIX hydrolase [Dehalococcoidia bacterium]